jgi:hypothetical protein
LDSAAQSETLTLSLDTPAQPSFDYLKLLAWIGATAASWVVFIALGRLVFDLMP